MADESLGGSARGIRAKAAGDVKVGIGFGEQIATAIAPLMVRTQGLQTLRDSAFTLCVAYMNGFPDPETYMRIKADRFDKAMALIEKELPSLPARVAAPTQTVGPPALPPPASAPLPAAASGVSR
jgi:hypothetical protein